MISPWQQSHKMACLLHSGGLSELWDCEVSKGGMRQQASLWPNIGQGRGRIPRWMSWTAAGRGRRAADLELSGTRWHKCCKSFLLCRCCSVRSGPFTKNPVSATNAYKPQHFCFLPEFVSVEGWVSVASCCLLQLQDNPLLPDQSLQNRLRIYSTPPVKQRFTWKNSAKMREKWVMHSAVFALEKLPFQ